jgi:hypothetical protein
VAKATRSQLLYPASSWLAGTHQNVIVWHGCTSKDANEIYTRGVDLSKCRTDTDFGQGFYTTTINRQAQHWAWIRYYDLSLPEQRVERPVVLRFVLVREELGKLESMSFVSGAFDNDNFWSLVQHCRRSPPAPAHHRHENGTRPDRWYDMVFGPVSAFWRQRLAVHDGDQLSFHTVPAISS